MMRLSSINPASILLGPVFQKEMRSAGRRRGTYIIRGLYAAALLALVVIAFTGIRTSASHYTGVQRLQAMQSMAPQLAMFMIWFQFIALALTAPILTGPAVCDERRAGTLSALMTTPLTAAQIVCGKLMSRLVMLAILALLVAPLLLAIRVFGGLDARIVLAATAVSLSTAFIGAALGLMYSLWHRRGTAAAAFALLTLILIQSAPSAVEGIIYYVKNESTFASSNISYKYHQDVLATCSPAVMGGLTMSTMLGGEIPSTEIGFIPVGYEQIGGARRAIPLVVPTWLLNTVYNLFIGLVIVGLTTVAMRRAMVREGAMEGGAAGAAPARKRRKTASTAPGAPAPDRATPAEGDASESEQAAPAGGEAMGAAERQRRSRQVTDNPVLWREVRQATFGSKKKFAVIAALALVGLGLVYYWAGSEPTGFSLRSAFQNEGLHGALMVVGVLAIMIQPVFMTTGGIAGEREARTWDVLLATPLSARSVVLGKFAGSIRSQWFLPSIVVLHFALSAALGHVSPLLPLHVLLIFLGPTLLFTATGQLFSLLFKRGVAAAVCNLLLALALWLGVWIVIALVGWYTDFDHDRFLDPAVLAASVANPMVLGIDAVEPAIQVGRRHAMSAVYTVSGTETRNIGPWAFTGVVFVVFAAYAVAALGAMSLAVAAFPRFSGRAYSVEQTPEAGVAAGARVIVGVLFVAAVGGIGFLLAWIPGLVVGVLASIVMVSGAALRARLAGFFGGGKGESERPPSA